MPVVKKPKKALVAGSDCVPHPDIRFESGVGCNGYDFYFHHGPDVSYLRDDFGLYLYLSEPAVKAVLAKCTIPSERRVELPEKFHCNQYVRCGPFGAGMRELHPATGETYLVVSVGPMIDALVDSAR